MLAIEFEQNWLVSRKSYFMIFYQEHVITALIAALFYLMDIITSCSRAQKWSGAMMGRGVGLKLI